jgi:hypothetical protein
MQHLQTWVTLALWIYQMPQEDMVYKLGAQQKIPREDLLILPDCKSSSVWSRRQWQGAGLCACQLALRLENSNKVQSDARAS